MNNLNDKKEKKDFIGKLKASFSGRKFRSGVYVSIISAVVIVIVLVLNMLISAMDIQVDLSSKKMYTLTSDTKDMVKGLKDDITIYYMIQPGNETDVFERVAKKYDALSDKITLVKKDPVLYPTFASQYVEDEITENSFVVVNNTNGRAKYVAGSELQVEEMNYQTYQSQVTGIDVEGKLTSAIQYVTTTDLPVLYVVGGHGETATSETFNASMDKLNIDVKELSTLSEKSIPKDCDILYINSPQADFSEDETKMIKDYLAAGGKAIVTLNYFAEKLTNFKSILEYYGVVMVDGIVFEGDASKHANNYPHYIVPNILSHDITRQVNSSQVPVFMLASSGLKISDTKRSSLKIDPLLSTSDSAYSKVSTQIKSAEKEEGDIDGPFYVGLIATDTYNDVSSTLAVYSSDTVFGDETANYGNADLLTGTIGFMADKTDMISIPTKSIQPDLIATTQNQAIFWGGITVIIIPATILLIGIVIVLRRRKK